MGINIEKQKWHINNLAFYLLAVIIIPAMIKIGYIYYSNNEWTPEIKKMVIEQ